LAQDCLCGIQVFSVVRRLAMEVETHVCDDEVLLPENSGARFSVKRVWPGMCALMLFVAAGMGGRAAWKSSQVSDVVSLQQWAPWSPSEDPYRVHRSDDEWRDYVLHYREFDVNGCSRDGEDCQFSRCCARQGSECYRKDSRWASCNETCLPFTKWEGGYVGHGHWVHTTYPVWDCSVLSVRPAPEASTQVAHQVATTQPDPTPRVGDAEAPTQVTQQVATPTQPDPTPQAGDANNPTPRWGAVPPFYLWPNDEYFKASVYGGCQEDGLDCRYSRCCAREGSRCYLKNDHWASCNETCFPYSEWQGAHKHVRHGAHHHGSWRRTNHVVWDCTDITIGENDNDP